MITQDTKNRLMAFNEQITGLGLKLGVPVAILAVGYLLYTLFADKPGAMATMTQADRAYFIKSLETAGLVLKWSSIAVVGSLILRFFYSEIVGLLLTITGAAVYFGIPMLFERNVAPGAFAARAVTAKILGSVCVAGLVCLMPGIWLVLRDSLVRIWRGISDKRVVEHRLAVNAPGKYKRSSNKLLNSCWDMAYCKDFIRAVCPAAKARKSCWRLKVGCNCSEQLILQAVAGEEIDNDHYRGFVDSFGLKKPATSRGSAKAKRARCRRCVIYSDHQRQKYRLLCPMVFPAVGLAFYMLFDRLQPAIASVVSSADRFLSFVATSSTAGQSGGSSQAITVMLVIVWLAFMTLCYALRALEYLIFDLQV